VRLLAWNIQHGGGTRVLRIVEEVAAYDPDVFGVTEYRATPGVALCAAMKERGLPYCETTNPPGDRNGIRQAQSGNHFSDMPFFCGEWFTPAPKLR
jgi:hypothetical protein